MKQTRPVKAPVRARLNGLTRQDLRTATGGGNGTIIVEHLMGISGGAVVSQGLAGPVGEVMAGRCSRWA